MVQNAGSDCQQMTTDYGGVRVEVEARPAWPTGVPIKSVELKDVLGGAAIGLEVPEPVWRVPHTSLPSRQRHPRDASFDELTVALRSPQLVATMEWGLSKTARMSGARPCPQDHSGG